MWWDELWQFLYKHYIFHTFVVIVCGAIVAFIVTFIVALARGKIKKFIIGRNGIEVHTDSADAPDPKSPCPYHESKSRSEQVEKNTRAIESINEKLGSIIESLDEMHLNHLKTMFYTLKDHPEEKLIAGLKYIARGGNHDTKKDVIEYAKNNLSIYKAAITVDGRLRIWEIDELVKNQLDGKSDEKTSS